MTRASTVTVLADFAGTNGGNPAVMSLVQGLDGALYGTTFYGGANGLGAVFKYSAGTITLIHSFAGTSKGDGAYPAAGLVLATNGSLYGTTSEGGNGNGTVFSISAAGKYKQIYTFCSVAGCADGIAPKGALIQASDGKLYGITLTGGTIADGTVFSITTHGVLKTVYNFTGVDGTGDGFYPYAGLIEGTDGKLYGTTDAGGTSDTGTIYQLILKPKISESVLHNLTGGVDGGSGGYPIGPLVQGLDGNFYGTTPLGGHSGGGPGNIFQITPPPGDALTTWWAFNLNPDGANPLSGVVQGTDGNFYGTTANGGKGVGIVFGISGPGALTNFYSFSGPDGENPWGGLVQATDGNFYGTTLVGGSNTSPLCAYDSTHTCGVIYSLSVGLGPFVKAIPVHGKPGTKVIILGNGLTGSTAVSFNGTPAAFVVVSDTEITTKVPAGAATGPLTVTTPGGILTSNVPFRVP